MQKIYKFSEITYKILRKEIINIEVVRSQNIFKEWFNFNYEINSIDLEYLKKLIETNRYNIDNYIEYQLFGYFINPLLHKVYFYGDNYREWLQEEISGIVNNIKITGILDFMVASGTEEAKIPYFFIQEFKRSSSAKHPKGQLLAQMAVAIENNKINKMRGAYNIGRFWFFILLEKINEGKYQYHESESFDSLKINDLKQIFKILKAVKHKYCK